MAEEDAPRENVEFPADLGENCTVAPNATVGLQYSDDADPPVIGDHATIRSGSIIYGDVHVGDEFSTGHRVLVREDTTVGDDVLVGTNVVIDGTTTIGSHVSLQTGVYVPTHTTICDEVFLGPHAVLTNDPYPIRRDVALEGPLLSEGVTVGANATILPGVTIGEKSFVAAGSVVTDDVPPETLAVGVPARHQSLPEPLVGGNELA